MAGLWAATIRETAIVAPVVVVAEHVWIRRRGLPARSRRVPGLVVGAGSTAMVGGFLLFEMWRRALPNGMNPEVRNEFAGDVTQIVVLFFTVSVFALPWCSCCRAGAGT